MTSNAMFCFQCQETMKNTGCTMAGVCGKKAETASRMDKLIRQLKILVQTRQPDRELGLFVVQSLFMTITNANFDDARLDAQLKRAEELTGVSSADAPLGVLSCSNEDVRSLRELLTYGLKGISAYADHAAMLGYEDDEIYAFLFKALAAAAQETSVEKLTALVLECGSMAVRTMELLDTANTGTFGQPVITQVRTGVGKRPGILISGHDLLDMKELLEQSADAGIDIYTHSEMLPAHYYPKLAEYPHLYGNYGNAWHRQNVEFAAFNGPILMTTNCITPVQPSYKDRIFTTGMAGYPGVPHIPDRRDGKPKDFSAVIELAKKCPPPKPLEDGFIVGGFAHNQVLALADSGNRLVEPFSGLPVLVVNAAEIWGLLNDEERRAVRENDTEAALPELCWVLAGTITGCELLPAFRPERMTTVINGKKAELGGYFAVAGTRDIGDGNYCGVFNPKMIQVLL